MKCVQCGKENPENSLFCSGCGAQLQGNTQAQSVEPSNNNSVQPNQNYGMQMNTNNNPKNKTTIILIALVGLMTLIAIIFGAKYLIQQYKLKQVDKELQDQIGDLGDLDSLPDVNQGGNTQQEVKQYSVGDAVTLLDGSKWHVISVNGDNVVLFSDALSLETSPYGKTGAPEHQRYENSNVKEYLENTYLPNLKTSLSSKNGNVDNLSVRLLTLDEFIRLTNARWVSSTGELKLSSYDIYKSDAGDNFAWLSMTSNFWLQDYIIDTENNGFFYGAYFVKVDIDESSEYFSTLQIETDLCGVASTSGGCGAFYGVRPVIETTVKNIK